MGTRSLIAVQLDGEYKIAQYSQWDGYPEGQGLGCLVFLETYMVEYKFKAMLRNLKIIGTDEQLKAIRSLYEEDTYFPEFDRDTGSKILEIVQDGKTTSGCVVNNVGFAGDADCFGCEYAWVIDLDKRTFEAYVGYNKIPLTQEDRFYWLDKSDEEYHPVRKVAEWSLSNLPTKDEFLNAFTEGEE